MEHPSRILSFHSFGVMLHKRDGDKVSEYPVDPAQVALALSAKVRFDTGLLSSNTLFVRQEGGKKTVVEYHQPQKTRLYLDKSETALRVPLPNVFSSASICWGTVQRASDNTLQTTTLAEDWVVLLGSRFNDHGVGGKSKSHPSDIRQMLVALEKGSARAYPKPGLLPVGQMMAQALGDKA